MVFFPSQFNKLGKSCKDLLGKDYDFGVYSLTVKHKTQEGLEVETAVKKGKSTSASNKVKTTVDKVGPVEVECCSDSGVALEATLNQLAKGVEAVIKTKVASLDKVPSGSATVSYSIDGFSAQVEVDFSANAKASAVIGHDGLSVGAQVAVKGGELSDYNVASQLQQGNVTLALVTTNKADNLTASYFQKLNTGNLIGVEYSINNEKAEECNLAIGSEYKLDDKTMLKSKINSCGCLAMALKHNLQNNIKVNLASSFDYQNNFAVKAYGIGFTVGE